MRSAMEKEVKTVAYSIVAGWRIRTYTVVRSGDYRIREIQFCHIQIRFFAKDIRFDAGRFLTCFGVLGFCCFLLLQQEGLTDDAIRCEAVSGDSLIGGR